MPLETQPSRFAVLPDDVPEPLQNKKASKSGNEASKKKKTDKNKASNGTSNKGNNTNKKQTLKSLAFGGLNDGKKKGGPTVSTAAVGSASAVPGPSNRSGNQRSGQWEEWRQRDDEVVEGAYESELEAALIQSQLEFQTEQARRAEQGQPKSKSKKKPVPVPLNEFNAKLQLQKKPDYPSHFRSSGDANGGLVNQKLNEHGRTNSETESELIERFRIEARLELERGKKLAMEREMLKNRQSQVQYQHTENHLPTPKPLDPRDETINTLNTENDELRNEVETYKSRLKKAYNLFQQAQELKDKAKLLLEVENLNKLNEDLNEEIRALHSQLEQERSRSHAALTECRKLAEQTRRRTNTETSQ